MRFVAVALVLVIFVGCASTEAQKQPDPPPAAKKPTKADLAASQALAQEAMAKLQRAQAAAAEAAKKCPAADAVLSPEELELLRADVRAEQEKSKGPLLPENASLNDLGRKLAAKSAMPALGWSFRLATSSAVETYSTPGGDVVITAGAVRMLDNEAQLVALLAHEIAHVTNGDVLKTYGQVRHDVCVPAATNRAYAAEGLADGLPPQSEPLEGTLVAAVLKQRAALGPGKDAELAADRVAFDLVAQGGYDTLEFERVLAKLDHAAARTAQWADLRAKAPKAKGTVPPLNPALKRDVGLPPR